MRPRRVRGGAGPPLRCTKPEDFDDTVECTGNTAATGPERGVAGSMPPARRRGSPRHAVPAWPAGRGPPTKRAAAGPRPCPSVRRGRDGPHPRGPLGDLARRRLPDPSARARFGARGGASCRVTPCVAHADKTCMPPSVHLLRDLGDGPGRTAPLRGCPGSPDTEGHPRLPRSGPAGDGARITPRPALPFLPGRMAGRSCQRIPLPMSIHWYHAGAPLPCNAGTRY